MEQSEFKIGLPLRDNDGGLSYIVQTTTPEHKLSVYRGGAGMQDIHFQVHMVNENGDTVTLDDYEAIEEFNNATKHKDSNRSAGQISDLVTAAEAKKQAAKAVRLETMKQNEIAAANYRESIADKVPSTAKAVILAKLHQDDIDLISDYHGHRVIKTVVIGFSNHTRNLFPELRKVALNLPETEHLSTADSSHEHRENYSMGGGYYLGKYKNSNGWIISKRAIDGVDEIPIGARFELGNSKVLKRALNTNADYGKTSSNQQGYTLYEWLHTKKQTIIYIIELHNRVEHDEFVQFRDSAKANGGWYSRKFGQSPAGFAFETREAAHNWAQELFNAGAQVTDEKPSNAPRVSAKPKQGNGDKLRTMADKLQNDIDNKRADRQENTAKRQAEAHHARSEADRLERTQQAMRAVADMIDAGTLPANLAQFKSKKSIYEAMSAKRGGMVSNGYHSYNTYEDAPSDAMTDDQKQLWTLLGEKDPDIVAAEKLKACLNTVKGSKIPGYFPTPDAVLDDVLEQADLEPHHDVLEPTAGDGAMIRRIKPLLTTGKVEGYEINRTLWDICNQQSMIVSNQDFMDVSPRQAFDRVIMNPPFENLQDCELVRHAFKFLKPEGRLVAVMSPSWQHNSTSKAVSFREWLNDGTHSIDHYHVQDVDAGAFKESGTNISTVILTIQRV